MKPSLSQKRSASPKVGRATSGRLPAGGFSIRLSKVLHKMHGTPPRTQSCWNASGLAGGFQGNITKSSEKYCPCCVDCALLREMFPRYIPLRLPALLTSGLFSLSAPIGQAEEIAPSPTDERARAAEMASAVTANGARRTAEDPLILAQVSAEPAEESPFPDEAESERVVVTGTNINSSDSPPFVPERSSAARQWNGPAAESLGDFFPIAPPKQRPQLHREPE